MSSVLFRVFLLLSPLFLVSSSSYENRKMDDNNLRRFTMVDVDLHFASLPSELGPDGLDNLMVASQVLLESGLDVHPTTIIELHVAITSQQIVEDHDIFLHDDSSSDVQLLIHLQVLIRYELAFENEDLSNMDKRVQRILTEDREELIALLKLLDFPFFATLEEVTLIPNDVPIESQPVQVSENETAHRTTVIIIFAVVGVGMLISFMTIIPLFCSKHEENQLSAEPSRSNTVSTSESCNGSVTSSGDDGRSSSKHVALSESLSSETNHDAATRGYIQRIYSDDKVNQPLKGLRMQKVYAEDKLKRTLKGFKKSLASMSDDNRSSSNSNSNCNSHNSISRQQQQHQYVSSVEGRQQEMDVSNHGPIEIQRDKNPTTTTKTTNSAAVQYNFPYPNGSHHYPHHHNTLASRRSSLDTPIFSIIDSQASISTISGGGVFSDDGGGGGSSGSGGIDSGVDSESNKNSKDDNNKDHDTQNNDDDDNDDEDGVMAVLSEDDETGRNNHRKSRRDSRHDPKRRRQQRSRQRQRPAQQ